MKQENRSMPASDVIPLLAYPDVLEATEWLCAVFGFAERLRIGSHRVQLTLGTGALIVVEDSADPALPAPASWMGHSVMARVSDVDQHFERSRLFGAQIISPPVDYPYGERQYTVEDLGGHRWTFSQTIADVDPKSWGGLLI
jgi:uncharacterized glyoxalase superfamily protein PhnB